MAEQEASTPAPAAPAETTPPPTGDEGKTATFTQADMDRVVSERVNRTKAQYADYADLKAAAEKLAKIEAENASETEKAVKAAREEGRSEVLTAANMRLVNAEARALAAAAKARNPVIAVRSLDLSSVKVSDDGSVDADAIRAQLTALQESDAYLFGDSEPTPPPPVSFDGGPRSSPSQADEYERFYPTNPIRK